MFNERMRHGEGGVGKRHREEEEEEEGQLPPRQSRAKEMACG